jgi:hypothetical protein
MGILTTGRQIQLTVRQSLLTHNLGEIRQQLSGATMRSALLIPGFVVLSDLS